jgi:hypothetical protein
MKKILLFLFNVYFLNTAVAAHLCQLHGTTISERMRINYAEFLKIENEDLQELTVSFFSKVDWQNQTASLKLKCELDLSSSFYVNNYICYDDAPIENAQAQAQALLSIKVSRDQTQLNSTFIMAVSELDYSSYRYSWRLLTEEKFSFYCRQQ